MTYSRKSRSLFDPADVARELDNATPGTAVVYHVGNLAMDTEGYTDFQQDARRCRSLARQAYDSGLFELVQERGVSYHGCRYMAVRRQHPAGQRRYFKEEA